MSSVNSNQSTKGIGPSKARFRASNSWFLGIGINQYPHFPKLINAVKDVQDIISLLQGWYGFSAERTVTLFDEAATRTGIIRALDRMEETLSAGDSLIIYYSGHGHLKVSGASQKGFWIPFDARPGDTSAFIRNNTIKDYLESINSRHILLLSDSCFSGSLFVGRGSSERGTAAEELERRHSRWAICSGRHDEEVFDGKPGTNSPFAESILDILGNNRNPLLNVGKVAVRTIDITRANYTQLPIAGPIYGVGHKGGEYVFRLKVADADLWVRCHEAQTVSAYREYIEYFPNGAQVDQALECIQKLEEEAAWHYAVQEDQTSRYEDFLKTYPNGVYAHLANSRLQQPLESSKLTVEDPNSFRRRFSRKLLTLASALGVLLLSFFCWQWFGPKVVQGKTENNTVTYAGQTYPVVELIGLTWMAENLNLTIDDSWCNGQNDANCAKYGRLYTWQAARSACKQMGWRLPTYREWQKMAALFGGADEQAKDEGRRAYAALMPGGRSRLELQLTGWRYKDGTYEPPGQNAIYWSDDLDELAEYVAVIYFFGDDGAIFPTDTGDKKDGYACRCVR